MTPLARTISKISAFFAAILFVLWLSITIIFRFVIDIDKLLREKSPVALTYSSYQVKQSLLPYIVLYNVQSTNMVAETVEISFNIFTFSQDFKIKINNCFLDASSRINSSSNIKSLLSNHYQSVLSLINNKQNFEFDIKNINIIFFDNTHVFEKMLVKNSATNFEFNSFGAANIALNAKLSKGKQSNFTALIGNANMQFEIVENYNDAQYVSGSVKLFNKNTKNDITAQISLNDEKNIQMILAGYYGNGAVNINYANDDLLASIQFSNLRISNYSLLQNIFSILDYRKDDKIIPTIGNLKVQLAVDELDFNKQKINNLLWELNKQSSSEQISSALSANFDMNGAFKLQGILDSNQYRSFFAGNFTFAHNDLNTLINNLGQFEFAHSKALASSATGNVKISSVDLVMDNISGKIGDDASVEGALSFKSIGNNPRLDGALKLNNMDVNSVSIIAYGVEYFNNLVLKSKDANYLDRFIPIRTNDLLVNLDFETYNTKLAEDLYSQLNLCINFSPSNIKVRSFKIVKDDWFISGKATLDASSFQPSFMVNISDGKLAIDKFQDLLVAIKPALSNKINLDALALKINAKIGDIKVNNLALKNFTFDVLSNQNVLILNSMSFNALGSDVKMNGVVVSDPFLVNMGYVLNNIDLATSVANAILPLGTGGLLSVNGSLNFDGDTLAEMLYSLNIQSDFIGRNITIPSVGATDLLAKIKAPAYQQQQLAQDLLYYASNGSTSLEQIKGSMEMNQGVISIKRTQFTNAANTGIVDGAVNLYKLSIDVNTDFNFDIGGGPAPKNPLQLKLKVQKDLFHPAKSLELVNVHTTDKKE